MVLTEYPLLVFVLSTVLLWISEHAGARLRGPHPDLEKDEQADLGMLLAGALTLLGLIIGFTFSMAIARYDQRKSSEAAEAAAIGTEYLRASLLPVADAGKVRDLLRKYLAQRMLFYTTRDTDELDQLEATTSQLESELWSAIQAPVPSQLPPSVGVTVTGMNDVFNSRTYTHSAWLNRIPRAAWILMVAIALCCTALIGYSTRGTTASTRLFLVLPLIVSIAFFLIADIDSPRRGVIRVPPLNLVALSRTLR